MASQEEMKSYATYLAVNTPDSSKGRPVTEIAVFKLQDLYVENHAAAMSEFESQVISNTTPGSAYAQGIRKLAWGFSADSPDTLVWILDWERIEDHWDFWLRPGFPPLMEALSKLFQAGRPLVRHYDFGGDGMLDGKFQAARVMAREGYAVDVNEDTWWCTLLGYETEAQARADTGLSVSAVESHILQLRYA
ncbi:unnamed protein product [Clonostachys solani]|uniref:Uncharacterized protein n=1 Tax=Clonostachys solani TaxID=160281 RepID=A0A9N9VZ20_9HYPO|nr:unnamed protein product [Clonostachys solani]